MPSAIAVLVVAVGPDEAALLAHHDRGAGVLAHRQHAARGDVGVLQKVVGDELVVRRRLRIVQDRGELLQVARPQQMVDVDEGLLGEAPQGLGRRSRTRARRAFRRAPLPRRAADRASRRARGGRGRRTSGRGLHGRRSPSIRTPPDSPPSKAPIRLSPLAGRGDTRLSEMRESRSPNRGGGSAYAARGVEFSVSTAKVPLRRGRRACGRAAGLAQDPGDPRERLEVVGAGPLGREQQEDEIDRLAVEGLEVDRPLEPGEQARRDGRASAACRAGWRCRRRCRSSRGVRAAAAFRRSSRSSSPVSRAACARAPGAPAFCRSP